MSPYSVVLRHSFKNITGCSQYFVGGLKNKHETHQDAKKIHPSKIFQHITSYFRVENSGGQSAVRTDQVDDKLQVGLVLPKLPAGRG